MHTPRSAARAAGVSKSAIYRAIKTRRLPAYKLNGGSYAIYPAELLRAFPSMAQAAANTAKQSSGSFSFPMWDVSWAPTWWVTCSPGRTAFHPPR